MNQQKTVQKEMMIYHDAKDKPVIFSADELKKTLERSGYQVSVTGLDDLGLSEMNRIILATRQDGSMDANFPHFSAKVLPCTAPQSYSIRIIKDGGQTTWYVIGGDSAGVMNGGLDFAQTVEAYGLEAVSDCDKTPYIRERGIKFNIPLDARTPSYSDSGDAAQENIPHMWEMDFWTEFLDQMARSRLNVLSLWSLHPFPSLVTVPEYPDVALPDVMKTTTLLVSELEGRGMSTPESLQHLKTLKVMTMEDKVRFWREVMQVAADRGIDIYLFTWNMFLYGTENAGYPFSNSLEDSTTADYFRKSVKALIQTYPLLKGIGITAGENMSRNAEKDEAWLYETYGQGINDALALDPDRTFRLIHRIQYTNIPKALGAFSKLHPRCALDTSFKYSQAHVYSSTKPGYIHDKADTYLQDIGDHKTWLTVRDDDHYLFRGGSDPTFIRSYLKHMPHEKLKGFYLGPDGYTWGREYITKDASAPRPLVLKKRWYSFLLWGRLAYDPDLPDALFIGLLQARFPDIDARKLFGAWSCASRVVPLVNRFHHSDCQLDFQWYPEACAGKSGFHDIHRFIQTKPQPGESIMSIPEYADARLNGMEGKGQTPVEIAQSLWDLAQEVHRNLEYVNLENVYPENMNLENVYPENMNHENVYPENMNHEKKNPMNDNTEKGELSHTVRDILALAQLGKYYSRKILGATNRWLSSKSVEPDSKRILWEESVANLKEASLHWKAYAELVGQLYHSQALTRLIPDRTITPDLPRETDIAYQQMGVDGDILKEIDIRFILQA